MIPREVLDAIKNATDLTRLVEQSGIRLRGQAGRKVGSCPFCAKSRTPAFTVYGDHYYCFRCAASGSTFDWVQKHNGMTFTEAVQYLADCAGITLPDERQSRVLRVDTKDDTEVCNWWWQQKWNMVRAQLDLAMADGPPEPLTEEYDWAECCGRMLRWIEALPEAERLREFWCYVTSKERAAWLASLQRKPDPDTLDIHGEVLEYVKYLLNRNLEHARANGWNDPDSFIRKYGAAEFRRAIDTAPYIPNYFETQSPSVLMLVFDSDDAGVKATLKHIPELMAYGFSIRIPDFAAAELPVCQSKAVL